jgi:hypothetical protein
MTVSQKIPSNLLAIEVIEDGLGLILYLSCAGLRPDRRGGGATGGD